MKSGAKQDAKTQCISKRVPSNRKYSLLLLFVGVGRTQIGIALIREFQIMMNILFKKEEIILKDEYISYVFLHMMYDLMDTQNKQSWYSRLRCAHLLATLLIDNKGLLLRRVSEITGIETHFVTINHDGPTELPVGMPSNIELPDLSKAPPGMGYKFMSREEYLKHFAGMPWAGRSFSVEDVIKKVRDKLGGAHFQKIIEGELEKDLIAAQSIEIFGESFFSHAISKIRSTTLRAMIPLLDELQSKHPELKDEILSEYEG